MVNFCILITKRQALVLREEFPGTLRMVLLFRNLVEAVQLFIPRSVLVVNLAINRKAGDFLQVPQGFFLPIEGIRHPAPLLTSPPNNKCLRPYGKTLARLGQHHKCQRYPKSPDETRDIESASSILGGRRYKTEIS